MLLISQSVVNNYNCNRYLESVACNLPPACIGLRREFLPPQQNARDFERLARFRLSAEQRRVSFATRTACMRAYDVGTPGTCHVLKERASAQVSSSGAFAWAASLLAIDLPTWSLKTDALHSQLLGMRIVLTVGWRSETAPARTETLNPKPSTHDKTPNP